MMVRMAWPLLSALIVVLTVISGAAMAVGQGRALHPALLDFRAGCETVEHPCWRGIILGQTTLEATRIQLLEAGYTAGIVNDSLHFQYFYSDGLAPGCVKLGYVKDAQVLSYLRLYCIQNIMLGDVAASLGSPQAVVYRFSTEGNSQLLSYRSQGGLSGIMLLMGSGWSSLYSPLTSIELFEPGVFERAATRSAVWRGFMPLWRYCRLEPDYPICS
jgi:hypothetical protein